MTFYTALFLLLLPAMPGKQHLHDKTNFYTEVKEPSDMVPDGNGGYVIVSDNGRFFRTDEKGNKIQHSSCHGMDFEAIATDGNNYYISDERTHTISVADMKTLECNRTFNLPIQSGSNDGLETFFYDPEKKVFIGITEKSPVVAYTFDTAFEVKQKMELNMASDISSGCYHKGFYYLLSDEDHRVFQCKPDFSVVNSWSVKIINPEGICFNAQGQLVICSDEMQRIFIYDFPPNE